VELLWWLYARVVHLQVSVATAVTVTAASSATESEPTVAKYTSGGGSAASAPTSTTGGDAAVADLSTTHRMLAELTFEDGSMRMPVHLFRSALLASIDSVLHFN
jgi:hypothetical protein